MGVSIDTKNIAESGYKGLIDNGFNIAKENVFVRLNEDTKNFIMTAFAEKNNKQHTFKMNLSDNDFVCVEDDTIKIDLSKYKNEDLISAESKEAFRTMQDNRTALDWAKKYAQYVSDYIELYEDGDIDYTIKTIEDNFETLIEYLNEANVKCKDFLSDELYSKLQDILVNPKLRKYIED